MKNLKKGKRIALISAVTALGVGVISLSTISLAKFVEGKKIEQTFSYVSKNNISIFLNANIWNDGKDDSGNPVTPVYYLWVTNAEKLLVPSRHVTPVIEGVQMSLDVFEYNPSWATTSYALVFIRANPNVAITSFTTWPSSAVWNQTANLTYESDKNYYCIVNWNQGAEGKSGYQSNRIVKNGETLTWAYH